jgi:hypothetical protein
MTSRRVLWVLLFLAASAPIFDATLGCSFDKSFHGSIGRLEANAVECSCTFPAQDGRRTLRVQASADDAEQDGVEMDLTSVDLDLGDKVVGLRFDAVGLPPQAQIQSAFVRFTADDTHDAALTVRIEAEAGAAAPSFASADEDLSLRVPGAEFVDWMIDPWDDGDAQQTPDLRALVQELVDLDDWSSSSPVVLRFLAAASGERVARSWDGTASRAPELRVSYTASLETIVPACVDDPMRQTNGYLEADSATDQCNQLAMTLGNLNAACGLPSTPVCMPVDPNGFEKDSCDGTCAPNPLEEDCSDYDPVAFMNCIAMGGSFESCKAEHAAATHDGTDNPICVASGSALALHAFGRRSLCEVEGIAEIQIGDREPKHDPPTHGRVEILAEPCPAGDCFIHPFFRLDIDPITFQVRWAKDPTFTDLAAVGSGLDTALLEAGKASFLPASVAGTGSGRRGSDGRSISATNQNALDVGVDWVGRTCSLRGSLVGGAGDDGVCEADGATFCSSDADCTAVGGACALPPDDSESMTVDVTLDGALVNQPPNAATGAQQAVECTTSSGAEFALDGRDSSDTDGNLALASWRAGSRTGPEISNDLLTTQTLGVGASESYVLRVIDALGQLDLRFGGRHDASRDRVQRARHSPAA